jgi:hypothetical protein
MGSPGSARYAQSAVRGCPLPGHGESVVPSQELRVTQVVAQNQQMGEAQG